MAFTIVTRCQLGEDRPMKMYKILTLLAFIPLLFSCESVNTKEEVGFTMSGEKGSCVPMEKNKVCTEIFTDQDQYAANCKQQGHQVIQCDCHEFLCKTDNGKPLNTGK
ncbi:MAG: hypothetical protein CME64_11195 [Halobacteriovoraceae bacterium]|nr:hypothetical protein [Halobacteriovoraceae bacterium]